MKSFLKQISLFGIIALAAVMVFFFVSCQNEPPDNNPQILPDLQGTTWTDNSGNELTFTKTGVTVKTASGQSQSFTIKDSVKNGETTILYFSDSKGTDYIIYGNGVVIEVKLGNVQKEGGSWNKEDTGGNSPEYWSITWNLNGGEFASGSNHPTQIAKGAVLARPSPDPTKNGNTFGGWYTNSGLTQTYNFSSAVNGNLTLYAKWEAGQTNPGDITYTVTQIGGVNGTSDSTGIMFTFSASIDSLGLTATDIYVNWPIAAYSAVLTGSGASRTLAPITVNSAGTAPVSIYKTGIETTQKSVVVYKAGETILEYWSINWNLNGGTRGTDAQYLEEIEKGTVLARPFPDPTKIDNAFRGWYTDSALTQAYNFASPVIADLNLYAKWEAFQPPAGTPVSGSTLAAKLAWLSSNAVSNTTYTIEVSADEEINPHTLSYTSRSNITIILWGSGGEKVVTLSQNGSIFTIESGVTLGLAQNIMLQGRSNNTVLVSVNAGGKLIMNTGAKITGNTSSSYDGGGVHVNGGTFTMVGGEISGNSSSYYGGGVYVESGTFTIEGGKIIGNTTSERGGGVAVNENGTFTMIDGEISGNTSSNYSDGVYVTGTFTMEGGKISGNTGTGRVVYVASNGTFTMEGGEISDNNNGVYVENGTFTMSSGKISGNAVSSDDSGVYVKNGTFTMNGGEISSNGRGVYVENGTFTMENGEISDNMEGGVYVISNGAFTMEGGRIFGHTSNSGVVVSNGTFTMESGEISDNTVGRSSASSYSYGGGVYVSGSNAIFTMNGGTISGNSALSRDFSYGGGVCVHNSGTFTMNNGKISNNNAILGAGVYTDTLFMMNGGEISGNTATTGGGVCGSLTMNGGTISGNTGRGVDMRWYSTMSGGTISGNSDGGVVVNGQFVTFKMEGGEISGNTTSIYGGGVEVYGGTFIKTGGTIYGYSASDTKSNVVKHSSGLVLSNQGHAVYVDSEKRRETTAGPAVNLDSSKDGAEGGWEN